MVGYAMQEVQLITLKVFSPSTNIRLGGIVSARSVKYLGKLATKLADQETRDSWWLELREEVRHVIPLCGCVHANAGVPDDRSEPMRNRCSARL
jgi:hypothetical protein